MASHRTPSFSNHDADPVRSREGRRQAPATVHYGQPVSYSTRRAPEGMVSSTVPRSERRSEARYHNDSRSGASGRPDVRYGGSRQQSYAASRYADTGVQREYNARTSENRGSRHTGPADSQAIDDTGSDLSASTGPRKRLNSNTDRPSVHPRRPSEPHRPGRVSFEDPPPSNYGLSSRGGRDGDRAEAYHSSARVSDENDRTDTYGRTERRHPSSGEEGPRTIRLDNERSRDAARPAADKDRRNRGDESRASTANKQYHSNSGQKRRPSSPSRHGPADPNSTVGGPREDGSRSSKAFETYDQRQDLPRPSATRHGSGTQPSHASADATSRDHGRDDNATRDTEHVWQPWEVSKKGQRFRLAQFEGNIRLIQLDGPTGPYCDANNNPVKRSTALQALQVMSKRLEADVSRPGRESAAPETRRPGREVPRVRSSSASDSAEDTRRPHGRHERRDRDRRPQQSREDYYDAGPRDDGVDKLGSRLESTRLAGKEEPRRSMMFRRATDDNDAAPRRDPPRGEGSPQDEEDITSGMFGARISRFARNASDGIMPGAFAAKNPQPAPSDDINDIDRGMFGTQNAPPDKRQSMFSPVTDKRRR